MKKLFVAILALALSAGSFAQSNHKAHKQGKKGGVEQQDKMEEKHDLTDAQKTKMKSINENFRKNMQELNQNKTLDNATRKQRRQALIAERRNQMQAILTPEQRKEWDEQKGNRGGKDWKVKKNKDKDEDEGTSRRGGNRKEKREDMKEDLNLTNDQASRLKSANESLRTKMQTIRKDELLTKEQKREAAQRLQKEHKESLAQILTKEQIGKMQEARKERGEGRPVRNTK